MMKVLECKIFCSKFWLKYYFFSDLDPDIMQFKDGYRLYFEKRNYVNLCKSRLCMKKWSITIRKSPHPHPQRPHSFLHFFSFELQLHQLCLQPLQLCLQPLQLCLQPLQLCRQLPQLCRHRPQLCRQRPQLCRQRPQLFWQRLQLCRQRPQLCQQRPQLCQQLPQLQVRIIIYLCKELIFLMIFYKITKDIICEDNSQNAKF